MPGGSRVASSANGSYRGLAATANHFARETHMDELAHLVGMDSLEFRLKNLTESRLRAVLQTAANRELSASKNRAKFRRRYEGQRGYVQGSDLLRAERQSAERRKDLA